MKVLVTGGLGYIGSHTVVELIQKGYEVIIGDNLSNSSIKTIKKIEQITGLRPLFKLIDFRELDAVKSLFDEYEFENIIHFAALKSVSESVKFPNLYYENNVGSLENILQCVKSKHGKNFNLIFSSSCTVYGQAKKLPITEDSPVLNQESPYGETKKKCEEIISEFCKKNTNLNSISLRYFNPIGAHKSALIGELPNGVPQNLVPYITQTAIGLRKELTIFGSDYPTRDGTCIRDYIHISDLANSHEAALKYLLNLKEFSFCESYNVGTGKGTSVLEVVNLFEKVNNLKLNFHIGDRRPGDIIEAYADCSKINKELGWKSKYKIDEALESAWKWENNLKISKIDHC
tara:strand:+ start:1306 stop:2343 length:1038 start_codon:yes stop_codon:yes gene_type:complete